MAAKFDAWGALYRARIEPSPKALENKSGAISNKSGTSAELVPKPDLPNMPSPRATSTISGHDSLTCPHLALQFAPNICTNMDVGSVSSGDIKVEYRLARMNNPSCAND